MSNLKKKIHLPKASHVCLAGILLILMLAAFLLWFANVNSIQSVPASSVQVYFVGQYRIGDGPWQEIERGKHIPATDGEVTLHGQFHSSSPDGQYLGVYSGSTPIMFYTDHIGLTICEEGREPYRIDHENPLFGDSACGIDWTAHTFTKGNTKPIEIIVHNSHAFGNELAIDKMLERVTLLTGTDFEQEILASGENRGLGGILLMIASLLFFGTALFFKLDPHQKQQPYLASWPRRSFCRHLRCV